MPSQSSSPPQRGCSWNRSTGCPTHFFSLVVCRHPRTGKWLAVEENKERGWWLPGGFCECGDSHSRTAVKETLEEAGVRVKLKGVLRVENVISRRGGRQRVIYYAEPADVDDCDPKSVPDSESLGAAWMTVEELDEKSKLPRPEGLRGSELLDWARYVERGGAVYPLDVFVASEHAPVPIPSGRWCEGENKPAETATPTCSAVQSRKNEKPQREMNQNNNVGGEEGRRWLESLRGSSVNDDDDKGVED